MEQWGTWLPQNSKASTTKANANVLRNFKVTSATHSALKNLEPHADMRFLKQISKKAKVSLRTPKRRTKKFQRRMSFVKPLDQKKMQT